MEGAPGAEFRPTMTHGGRYLLYDIFGNQFEVTNKYQPPIMPIGRGAYGIVCSVMNFETREMVAIKKIANCDLKICDFGLARPSSESDMMTEYVVTRWYRAPELLLNSTDYSAAIDVWSVGCIFMELINRQPLFPGRDHMHQMRLITEVIGTPTDDELGFIRNEDARKYMRHLPQYPRRTFASMFPRVQPAALDLIERMLTFNPLQRITVEEALDHPYLERLHDIADEPICLEPFSFDFEQQALNEDQMKQLIFNETIEMNPNFRY
uniref:MAP kinase 5 n=1 Tax=Oryza punctata TaxID=4537 RepID=I0J194_ORYPU|nr:MAP kinase 5 [Oryza punctata]